MCLHVIWDICWIQMTGLPGIRCSFFFLMSAAAKKSGGNYSHHRPVVEQKWRMLQVATENQGAKLVKVDAAASFKNQTCGSILVSL